MCLLEGSEVKLIPTFKKTVCRGMCKFTQITRTEIFTCIDWPTNRYTLKEKLSHFDLKVESLAEVIFDPGFRVIGEY